MWTGWVVEGGGFIRGRGELVMLLLGPLRIIVRISLMFLDYFVLVVFINSLFMIIDVEDSFFLLNFE